MRERALFDTQFSRPKVLAWRW